MASTVDPDAIGFLVSDLSRLIRAEFERRIAAAGLGVTPGEGRALAHIARAGEERQNVIAERLGVEAMTLSAYVDRLEARGLVERRPDPADRRAKLVRLTPAADEVLAEVRALGAALREELSERLPDGEWPRLIASLKTVRDALVEANAQRKERNAA